MSASLLLAYREQTFKDAGETLPKAGAELDRDGHPCPSRDLDPDNEPAAKLVHYLVNDDLKPLADRAFGALAADLDPEEQQELLGRVTSTLTDPLVSELLHPDPKRSTRR